MDPITILLSLVVVLLAAAFIVQPFLSGGSDGGSGHDARRVQRLRERAELLAERNRIYAAIRDLDFDYKTNKVSDEDYQAQRYALVAQGVDVLQQLDALPLPGPGEADDPIENAIAVISGEAAPSTNGHDQPAQKKQPVPAGSQSAQYCPECGSPVTKRDRFCGTCGIQL